VKIVLEIAKRIGTVLVSLLFVLPFTVFLVIIGLVVYMFAGDAKKKGEIADEKK
jgi:cbb3-type cytochrome oxidase subunit 3